MGILDRLGFKKPEINMDAEINTVNQQIMEIERRWKNAREKLLRPEITDAAELEQLRRLNERLEKEHKALYDKRGLLFEKQRHEEKVGQR